MVFPAFFNFSGDLTRPISEYIDRWIESAYPAGLTIAGFAWLYVSVLLGLSSPIVVHEMGHAIAGKVLGFRILAIRAGYFQIDLPFHMQWSRTHSFPGAKGFVVLVPAHSQRLRPRAIGVYAAGPLANLASAAMVTVLLPQSTLFSISFAVISTFQGVVNLIPFRVHGVLTDGKRVLMLLRNSKQCERWLALKQLVADMRSGVEADHLRADFIAIATAVQDDSPDTVSAHTIAYYAAFYRHEDAEAGRLLEVCLKYSCFAGPLMREAVLTDAVIFQARRRKRVDLAEQWFAELPQKMFFPEHRFHAESAILEAKGDVAGALKKLDDAEAVVLKSVEPHRRELSLKYLRRWRAEMQQEQPGEG